MAAFPTETMKARKNCTDIYRVLKEKESQPGILYQAKISFKIQGETEILRQTKSERMYLQHT